MKKKLFSLVLAGFLLITLTISGQNKNYPTKKINGTEYYLYTVQASEGLFAIGRKFEIAPEEISKANPEIKSGLKVGQQILIPIQKDSTPIAVEKVTVNNDDTPEFIQHKVEKKQTLFSISRKYNVSQEEVIKYNPGIEKGLREGIVLQIPKEGKKNKNKEKEIARDVQSTENVKKEGTQENNTYIIHEIKANETLFSLGRIYKVKVIDIIRLNPGSAIRFAIGTQLRIPVNESNAKLAGQNEDSTTAEKNDEAWSLTSNNKVIRIAFLLPFMLDEDKRDLTTERFVDFYAGALMAVQEAKDKGVSFEIFTYDTEKSEDKMTSVLNNPDLKNVDLIIGPAFSNQVSLVSDFAKEHRINTLIPFTSKVPEIDNNPYLFQFNPGTDAEIKFTRDVLTGKYKNANIIFAEIPGISSFDEGKNRVEALKRELNREHKSFSRMALTTSDYADFKTVLKKGVKNIILFNTDKFAYISPFITPLRSQVNNYDIILFEQYSWKNQPEKLAESIFISPFQIKENSNKLITYDKQFNLLFSKDVSIDSPRFDLLGYDLSNYFISLINRYGVKFIDKIGAYTYPNYLQSQPRFERTSNGSGFVNQQLYLGEDISD